MRIIQYYAIYIVLISSLNSQVLGVIRNKIDNKPIEGVNILIGETGATTDKDGIFRIEYNLNEDIEFSHIGFRKLSLGKNIFLNNKLL